MQGGRGKSEVGEEVGVDDLLRTRDAIIKSHNEGQTFPGKVRLVLPIWVVDLEGEMDKAGLIGFQAVDEVNVLAQFWKDKLFAWCAMWKGPAD